jgi:pimeloyl-ACP methyl ester carboxylesterase
VVGSKDSVMEPRYVRHLAGYAPSAEVQELNGEGHLPMRTAPGQLAQVMENWLDRTLA